MKYYLEANGAALLEMARLVCQAGSIAERELGQTVERVFLDIWRSYLSIESNPRARVRLSHAIQRLEVRGYDDRTRIHKVRPHLQALADFGLVRVEASSEGIIYHASGKDRNPLLKPFTRALVDIPTMERRLKKEEHFAIATEAFFPEVAGAQVCDRDDLRRAVAAAYRDVVEEASGLASINGIIDTTCARLLARTGVCPRPAQMRAELDELRRESPREVRFHVDWYGEKAYVVLSDTLLSEHLTSPSAQRG